MSTGDPGFYGQCMSLYDELHCRNGGLQHYAFLSVFFGSAIRQVREAASHPDLLMSLNLSRNAVAMERRCAILQMPSERGLLFMIGA